ncbi:hypothetical protein ACH3XX_45120 [Streptomyces scabiei]|uniref:hypothetical protein n=1 Tax=Streptomyces scabiei TaxID=1930 RepID=UPI00068C6B7F|nr:hypothetical protein [Streptomyces scabiei]
MTQYQTVGVNARLKVFALLEAHGVPASGADDLVAALEARAATGAQSQAVELGGMAPRSRGPEFEDGWDSGVTAVSEALVGMRTGLVPARRPVGRGPLNWLYASRT